MRDDKELFSSQATGRIQTECGRKCCVNIDFKLVEMSVLSLKENDVIVLKYPVRISERVYESFKSQFKTLFPNNKIIILEEDLTLELVREENDSSD